nr:MAG TPA: hypothetical protein [Caudoviricetes sp.]
MKVQRWAEMTHPFLFIERVTKLRIFYARSCYYG